MEKIILKKTLKEKSSDFKYWQMQPVNLRLETLQKIREEYIEWKYDHRPGFQRVYTVIKQK